MASSKDSQPATWQDALSAASSAIASGLFAPDADVKFGLALIGAISTHGKKQQGQQAGGPGGAAGPGGPPGGGAVGSPSAGGPTPGGLAPAAGPAGGGAPNSAMPSQAAPGGPVPGGMTQGLTPNPDEMRRVLADVAGK